MTCNGNLLNIIKALINAKISYNFTEKQLSLCMAQYKER